MSNDHPSMQTWQADTYVTWAVLGEIIAAQNLNDKIRWSKVVENAQERCGDQMMHKFIRTTVDGIRDAADIARARFELSESVWGIPFGFGVWLKMLARRRWPRLSLRRE